MTNIIASTNRCRLEANRVLATGWSVGPGFTDDEYDTIASMISAVRSWQASHAQEVEDRERVINLFGPSLAYIATNNHPTFETGVF